MANMYFIAIVAPESIEQQVLKWKQFMKEEFDCSVALRSPAHITLIPPFWMDDELEIKIKKSIAVFSNTQTGFEINLKNFSTFKPKVIFVDVVPNKKLNELQTSFQESLINTKIFPISVDKLPFHPHVTIATRDLRKKTFFEAWKIFSEKKFEAVWIVNSISLLKHNQKNWEVIFTSHFQN
jgi:2'-5' RNA ligase